MALLNSAFRLLFRRIFHIVTAMTGFHTACTHLGRSLKAALPNSNPLDALA